MIDNGSRPGLRATGTGFLDRRLSTGLWESGTSADKELKDKGEKSLLELFLPSEKCKVNQMSGTDLGALQLCRLFSRVIPLGKYLTVVTIAYIGDVVFELFIRSRHVWPSKRTSDLQNLVVSIVRGKFWRNLDYVS